MPVLADKVLVGSISFTKLLSKCLPIQIYNEELLLQVKNKHMATVKVVCFHILEYDMELTVPD